MLATTTTAAPLLRLEHAELCAACHDLLPVGTPVTVGADRSATCLACTDDAPAGHLARFDAWSALDDADLRQALQARTRTTRRHFALSA